MVIVDVALVKRDRERSKPVDVAMLPVNGLRPLVGPALVMGPRQAAAALLGARTLVPVHDAHADDLLSLVFRRHGSGAEARDMARPGLTVARLTPGQRWEAR